VSPTKRLTILGLTIGVALGITAYPRGNIIPSRQASVPSISQLHELPKQAFPPVSSDSVQQPVLSSSERHTNRDGATSGKIIAIHRFPQTGSRSGNHQLGGDSAFIAFPENGIASLVEASDTIIVGEVGDVTDEFTQYYSPTATPDVSSSLPPLPEGIDKTIYDVRVVSVYKGSLSVDDHISMLMMGSASRPIQNEFDPKGAYGTQYLYFIRGSGDDYYGIPYGPFGRLDVSGSTVNLTDYEGGIAPFATDMSPSQFVSAVRTEVSVQLTATPTFIPTETPDDPTETLTPTPTPTSTSTPTPTRTPTITATPCLHPGC
jgi:hypothetical protein